MSEEIRLEVKEGWALLVVDRPKQFNAFNTGIVEEMDRLLDQVEANKDIRCLVITGSGEKSFISGADIGQMGSDGYTPADAHYLITCGYKVYNRVESLNIPVIAAVNGYCLGAWSWPCAAISGFAAPTPSLRCRRSTWESFRAGAEPSACRELSERAAPRI